MRQSKKSKLLPHIFISMYETDRSGVWSYETNYLGGPSISFLAPKLPLSVLSDKLAGVYCLLLDVLDSVPPVPVGPSGLPVPMSDVKEPEQYELK